MFGNDVHGIDRSDEIVEVAFWTANHVSDDVVYCFCSLIIDIKETRQIPILWVKRNYEWFETRTSVRHGKVRRGCGFPYPTGFTVR
ncbi:hypothetical protein GCM10009000_061720 [Halobacterium noricense]